MADGGPCVWGRGCACDVGDRGDPGGWGPGGGGGGGGEGGGGKGGRRGEEDGGTRGRPLLGRVGLGGSGRVGGREGGLCIWRGDCGWAAGAWLAAPAVLIVVRRDGRLWWRGVCVDSVRSVKFVIQRKFHNVGEESGMGGGGEE